MTSPSPTDTLPSTLGTMARLQQLYNEADTPKARDDLRVIMHHALRLQERMNSAVAAHRYHRLLRQEILATPGTYDLEKSRSETVRGALRDLPKKIEKLVHRAILRELAAAGGTDFKVNHP